jgi:hypothetical protein
VLRSTPRRKLPVAPSSGGDGAPACANVRASLLARNKNLLN